MGRASRRTLLAVVALTALVGSLSGQAFRVRPMMVELNTPPNRKLSVPLELHNTHGDRSRTLELEVVDLSQARHGGWVAVSPGDPTGLGEYARSARDWIEPAESQVTIDPLEAIQLPVEIDVPPGARGSNFAGLLARSVSEEETAGITFRIQFLIPLIIEIEGRPVRQDVTLAGVSMERHDPRDANPTTVAGVRVVNSGGTYSRVGGQIRIEREADERWRLIAHRELSERGIIPGATLELTEDLKRRLPSGTYRLRAQLSVDGRRVAPLEKEIDFEGDADIDTLAYDRTLTMHPGTLDFEVVPGATRTDILAIENPSDEPIVVRAVIETPETLQGVAMGELRGDMLSAAEWVQVRPSEFTLRPEGRQNVRVITQVPRDDVDYPHYYGRIVLDTRYEDGQSAGRTESLAHLQNVRSQTQPAGVIEGLSVAESGDEDGSEYVASARFVNIGNVHVEPEAQVAILAGGGRQVTSASMEGSGGELLPLGRRDFAGTVDLSGVEPGHYLLRMTMAYFDETEPLRQQRLVEVALEDEDDPEGRRIVTVLDEDDEEAIEEALEDELETDDVEEE